MSGISAIIKLLLEAQDSGLMSKQDIYFRGQRSKQQLIPALNRTNPDYKTENNLYCDSLVMGGQEISHCRSSWERLAIFQHFGVPTRLLDWSSSLINGLYFAIESCMDCPKDICERYGVKCSGNPVLWVLDPEKMHDKYYPSANKVAFTVGVDKVPDYEEYFIRTESARRRWPYKKAPIFLEIPWNNSRISRQKGYFTFHSNDIPLEKQITPKGGLLRIELKKHMRNQVREEMKRIGITEHDIYPDLVSLSRYLRKKYEI